VAKLIVSNKLVCEKWQDADLSLFRHPNPKYHENQRLGFSNFAIPLEIKLYDETDTNLIFPRGLISQIFELRPDFKIEDHTFTEPFEFPTSRIVLKDYQQPAVDAMLKRNQGLLIGPPACGKTVCSIEVIVRREQKSLVLVHTVDLLNQWVNRFKQLTDINPGIINADRWDIQPITIATVQSLKRSLDDSFLRKWGLIWLDECHHAPAYSFRTLISQFPARFRYGCTATPYRRDGLFFILKAVMGNIIYEIQHDRLYEAKEIIKPHILVVHTNFYTSEGNTYGKMIEAVTQDDARNTLILNKVTEEANSGHSCLVLSNRIKHAQRLHQKLNNGIASACLTSRTPKSAREEILHKMNTGDLQVLLATTLGDEGLDIRRLSRLFLVVPVRSVNKVMQQVGRIQRTFPSKIDAIVYDFRDSLCSLAESQYHTRLKQVYEAQGFEVEEVPYAMG
jgi:superfamily II DNA or RNA helicase